jgi:hypothetical protein
LHEQWLLYGAITMSVILCLMLLQLKHFLADFRLQTQDQIKTKGKYGNLVGLGHTLEHTLGTTIVLLPFLWNHPIALLACSIFDTVIHYHTDFIKMRYGTKDISKQEFWWELGMDQTVHQLTYVTIAAVVQHFA